MRWKDRPLPSRGDTRSYKCFAFFPQLCHHDHTFWYVWLEFYRQHEVFLQTNVGLRWIQTYAELID